MSYVRLSLGAGLTIVLFPIFAQTETLSMTNYQFVSQQVITSTYTG